MSDCCSHSPPPADLSQAKALRVVLAINLTMFFVEAISGLLARSTALLADSLDMLGDAAMYALALYVVHRGAQWKARAALVKGLLMATLGAAVLLDSYLRFKSSALPSVPLIGGIGTLAIVANLTCAILLLKHRNDDINMRSTWRCTRNDVLANAATLLGGVAVHFTGSRWPDSLVGVSIAFLVLVSAYKTVRESVQELGLKEPSHT